VVWDNTTVTFSNASQTIYLGTGEFTWKNTASAIVGTIPTAGLLNGNSGSVTFGNVLIDGVDLSAMGANPLFNISSQEAGTRCVLRNCKLNASYLLVAWLATSLGYGTLMIDVINCDSSGTNYKIHREAGEGKIDQETTVIMTGGASDGTTGISWKMASNANPVWALPLESFPIAVWNNNSGASKTATVQILTDSLTALKNDDIWMEIEYLADSGDPQSGFISDTKSDILQTGTAQPTSTATWTTTGITNVMTQQLQVSFTPQQFGPVTATIKLAKPSTTVYVNPVISIA